MLVERSASVERDRGFALVVTVALMVLLSLLAIGLLSLSRVSLRSSAVGRAEAEARANARMALILAISIVLSLRGLRMLRADSRQTGLQPTKTMTGMMMGLAG